MEAILVRTTVCAETLRSATSVSVPLASRVRTVKQVSCFQVQLWAEDKQRSLVREVLPRFSVFFDFELFQILMNVKAILV